MEKISTGQAPQAIGPYSQAIKHKGLVYCSGSIPLNPATMKVESWDIESQTNQVFQNMTAVLTAAGSSLSKVIKTTVFLKDMNDFQKMNAVYAQHFQDHKPARSTVQVAKLPMDVLVEIECIAEAS